VLIRREAAADIDAIRGVVARAFTKSAAEPGVMESRLVDELRADPGWIPALSLVAVEDAGVVGHVTCTRATIAGRPALGLGPLSVDPTAQGRGIGSALVHAVLGAADALDEPIVVLLGSPAYYHRFGFVLAEACGVQPPVEQWGPHFQVRTLATYQSDLRGPFRYAEPFVRTY
jgi:putative acetyltransferase